MSCEKIGVGVITCNRVDYLTSLLESIKSTTHDELIVINDHTTPIQPDIEGLQIDMYNNETNMGVCRTKNKALDILVERGCDHVFLIEDDMIIKSDDVFDRYITASEVSGIKHFNFCLHGEDNKVKGMPNPKIIFDYGTTRVSLYHNLAGCFSYYHSSVLQEVGLFDEEYVNAMDHVDHTMQIILAGYHPPFRWFADLADSDELIGEQDQNLSGSVIRKREGWMDDFKFGVERFYNKFNINVCSTGQPVADKQEVIDFLKSIKR